MILLLGIGLWYSQVVHIQVLFLILAAAFSLMLIRFISVEGAQAPVAGRQRGWAVTTSEILGQSSYPTYLFHGPLLMLISIRHSRLGSGGGLADYLRHPGSCGCHIRGSPGLPSREADSGVAEIVPETVRYTPTFRGR